MADDCGSCGDFGDCGDCGGCDCNCDDCGCDCNCNCDCLDNCCTGETNVILCCFLPSSNDPRRTHNHTNTDCFCCFWCTDRNERVATSKTSNKSSKKKKRRGFWSRLRSCFGLGSSPPSSPTRDQPKMDNVPPKAYNQDGRYPISDSRSEMTQIDYEEQHRRRAGWEGLDMPPREYKMDGKWSRPIRHGDRYGGHL
ncbi:hypothetical protein RND81_02G178200 [Saponaria officinalis]|uniref:Uncharacterized protein n=1 Tax=Saponaria officinalis TaxID=3572 RepID=A0AAW1MYT0_SAPOF